MKYYVIFTMLILNIYRSSAQNRFIEILAGVSKTNAKDNKANYDLNSNFNYTTSILLGKQYSNNIYVKTGLNFIKKGFQFDIITIDSNGKPNGQIGKYKYAYNYLTLPLKVGYKFGKNIFVFANANLSPAVLLTTSLTQPIYYNQTIVGTELIDIYSNTKKIDFIYGGDFGIGSVLKKKISLIAFFSINQSAVTFSKDYYFPDSRIKHKDMQVNLGLHYLIK